MLKKIIAALAVLVLSAPAWADPSLSFTATPVGGGLTAYDFQVNGNDPPYSGSFFSQGITFSSSSGINQVSAFGAVAVDDSANAATYNGIPAANYSSALDNWFYTPWTANTVSPGIVSTSTTYAITAGTGGGSQLTSGVEFAHIVSAGPVTWTGIVGRNGANFSVSGTTATPEPASLALLGLGGLALLARRRRRA